MRKSAILAGRVSLLFFFAAIALQANAINYRWQTGSGNWSTTTLWTPNGLPGANDSVYFTGNFTCNLNMNITVAHFEFENGFIGVFNQNAFSINVNTGVTTVGMLAMVLNGTGTFNGSDQNITLGRIPLGSAPFPVNGFVLNGATFNSTSDTFTIQGDFRYLAGTFNHENGWVRIRGIRANPGLPTNNITGGQNPTFYSLEFEAFDRDIFRLDAAMDVTVLDTLLESSQAPVGSNMIMDGDIMLKGDFLITYWQPAGNGSWQGNARIFLNGAGAQRIVGRQATFSWNSVENIIIDKAPTDTLYLYNYINAGADWHYRGGRINAGTSTVFFFGTNGIAVDSITGTHAPLYNVRFGALTRLGKKIIAPADVITVSNELIFDGNNTADVYSGTIDALGNITVGGGQPVVEAFCGGDATVIIKGTLDQLFHGQTRRNIGFLPHIVIDKPSGTLTMKDTIVVERSWTYIRGTVEAVLEDSYVNFVYNGDNSTPDAVMTIDGEGTSATMLFNNVGIDNPPLGTLIRRNLGGDLRIDGFLNVRNHRLFMNANDIFIENSGTTSIQRTTGYIVSETTPPPGPGLSRIHWFINNAPMGNTYTFPFGTVAGSYIPDTYTVQTPGVPSGTGSISIATYPTDPVPAVNNRPLPPGISHLKSFIGAENAARELDRFWVYECYNYTTAPTATLIFSYLDAEWNTGSNAITESLLRAHQWNPGTQLWDQPTAGATPVNTIANLATVGNVSTCSAFTLVDPTLPDLLFEASDTLLCAGEQVTFTDLSSSPPDSYAWIFPGGSPGTSAAASPVVTYSTPGTYDVILAAVYDGGTLRDTFFDYIHVGNTFSLASTDTDILCFGQTNGSIDVTPTGGNGGFTYLWNDNDTTEDRTGLSAGTYTVTVTDSFGCVKIDTSVITQPAVLNVTISNITNTLCSASCNGGATANPTGGTPGGSGYTYLWSPSGETTQTATMLCPVAHIVTVTDDNGCTDTAHVTIIGSPALNATITNVTPVSCVGACDGAITVSASGGTGAGTYTYDWDCTAPNTATVTGLCTGICTVTVSDGNNCTVVIDTLVPAPAAISLTIHKSDALCNNADDGRAWVVATGGTGALTYDWDGGTNQTNDTVINLPPGVITVVVEDTRGCTATADTVINEPSAVTITSINKTDVSCFNGDDGTATAVVTGGTPLPTVSYTYTWSPAHPDDDQITGLEAGVYTLIAADANGCKDTSTVTINEPADLVTTLAKSDVSCLGGNDGCAWVVSVTGGTGAPTFIWNGGPSTNDTICNRPAGLNTVIVTDTEGCTDTASITIGEPATGISLTMTKTDISCFGANDGEAGVNVTGGTGLDSIIWSKPGVIIAPGDSITGLDSGFIRVTAVDNNGCTRSDSVEIIEPDELVVSVVKTDITCFGANDGTLTITVTGGTPGYSGPTLLPSVGTVNGNTVTDLPPGLVCVTYSDASACSDSMCVTILEPADIVLVLDSTGVSCNGGSDGKARVVASGGTGVFTYLWDGGTAPLDRDSVLGLPPGPVSVTVTDSSGCTKVGTTTITEPAAMVLLMNGQDLTCNGSNDGIAWVTVSGGNAPYTYVWGGNPANNDTIVTGLPAGVISVTVTDSTGCTATNTILIDEPTEITITEAVTSVTCVGGSTGAINIVAAGGSPGYTFLWSDGSASQNLTGASEGFYSVIVTDASNCTVSESFTLQEGTRFEVTANVINATCGSADGEINVTVSGGTGTLNYIWSDGSNTNQDRTGLTGGTYTVTVTDATPCSQTLTIIVEEVGGPAVTGVVTDATTCAANDGAIDITATGGSTVYSYEWNDAILVADRTGLTTGTYTVTVTDDTTGCISISTFDVGAVNGITLAGASIAATCGGSNGSVTLTISLATPPYNIRWSNGDVTQDLTGVGAGAYSVTVTDNGGCTKSEVFTVSETGGVAVTGTPTHVTCFGAQNGSITLTAAGVNDYVWSNGATTKDITGLKPGIYAVTVNDTSSCATIEAFEITEPDAILVVADRSNISCNGVLDGGIDITVSGGTGAYTYSWTGPSFTASTEDISGRGAGTYNVTVSDGNACVSTLAVTLTEPGPIDLTLDTQSVRCGGDSNGVAWVIVTGGVPDFDYAWSRGTEVGVGDSVINLETGIIRVTVTDANNCIATDSILVPEPTPLTLTLTKTDITCFGADDGTATAIPGGGTPPYTYVWDRGSGVADPTVTALSPGPVVVLVTDSNACPIFDTITIVEPDSLTLTVTGTDVSCFGGNDGTAQVTVTGGRAPYSYAWSAGVGSTTASVTGLMQGVVYVTVTDSSLCTKVDSFTIAQPATPVTTTIVVTNVSCFGDSNGTAIVTPAGGTPGYTYSWDRGGPPTTDSTITGLWVGNAIVTVTDANGCEVIDTATITQPTQISLVTSKVDISCFGADDGVGRVVASGGTPRVVGAAYDYLWSDGNASLTLDSTTGLSAGTFTVTVTDSLGCEETGTVTIIEPDSIQLTITKVDISCYGLTDGEATVTASGGSGGFTYVWTAGTPLTGSPTVTGLQAGGVTVTVTDSRNCADSISTTIIEPDSLSLTISSTNVSCFGGNNGTAQVTVSGGTPLPGNTYLHAWTDGDPGNTNAVTGLPAGQVIVTVTDARQCTDTISANITQPLAALTTTITKTDVSCFNGNDGTALVTAAGGTPGYDYDWDRGTENDSAVTDLTAGIVRVTVTDANGCVKTDSITLIQPDELLLTIAVDSNASCNGGTDGGLTVSLTGGTADYVYAWNGTPGSPTSATSNSIDGLGTGAHTVVVTDANNCSASISEDIINRPGPQINSAGIVLTNPTCDQNNGAILLTPTTTDMPLSYDWIPSTLSGNNPTGLATGTYTVTISDRSTCDTVLTINLQEIPRPVVDFVKIKDSYCDDNDGQATAIVTSGVLPYHFEWIELPLPGTSIGSDSIITGLEAGIYILVVGDANGCDTTITFDIQNIASPNAAILPASPQTIFEGQTIDLVATADVPNPVFSWSPSEGLSCIDCDTLTAAPDESVTYMLVVVDSSTQCSDTAYMTVIVKDEVNIFVPNVITPNGDGINDYWRITELQEVFLNNELVIVNRWGDEIFRSKNYQNDFDGTYKNNKLPDGTYYYIIKLNDIDKSVSGPITIISE